MDNLIILCLYVDDIIYMGSSKSLIAEFKSNMMKRFEISDLGLLHYFLALVVKQGEDGFSFHKGIMQWSFSKNFICFTVNQQPHP